MTQKDFELEKKEELKDYIIKNFHKQEICQKTSTNQKIEVITPKGH